MLNKVSWFMITISISIIVLVTLLGCFFKSCDIVPFFEKKLLLLLPFQTSSRCLGKTMTKGVVTFFTMYWVTFLRLAFLIWSCARSFHRIFSQINIFHFFGESLSLPSAFVYFAIGKFLVPAACKIFCRK